MNLSSQYKIIFIIVFFCFCAKKEKELSQTTTHPKIYKAQTSQSKKINSPPLSVKQVYPVLSEEEEKIKPQKTVTSSSQKEDKPKPKTLSLKQINTVLKTQRQRILECFKTEDKAREIKVDLTIAPSGYVIQTELSGKSKIPKINWCLRDIMNYIKFPKFEGANKRHTLVIRYNQKTVKVK
jgi:hypothetical protein